MDTRHITTDLESVTCSRCGLTLGLPKDGPFPVQRVYLCTDTRSGAPQYAHVPVGKRRPDGSMGIALSPPTDALVDFILAHRHEGGAP